MAGNWCGTGSGAGWSARGRLLTTKTVMYRTNTGFFYGRCPENGVKWGLTCEALQERKHLLSDGVKCEKLAVCWLHLEKAATVSNDVTCVWVYSWI